MCPCDCKWSLCVLTDLPHSYHGICNEDEEDDEGLDKSGDGLLTFLKPSQNLCESDTKQMLAALTETGIYCVTDLKGLKWS